MMGWKPDETKNAQVLSLLREGYTLSEVAARLGVSKQRIQQRVKRMGYRTWALRDVHCRYCGEIVKRAWNESLSAIHACTAPACRKQGSNERAKLARAAARSTIPRRICANCGDEMERAANTPQHDTSRPSFCRKPACATARTLWHYHNDPAYQQYRRLYQREQAHAKREGLPPTTLRLADVRRWLAEGMSLDGMLDEITGTTATAEPPPLSPLSVEQERARAILAARGSGSQREVAQRFGVSRSLVYGIWRGERWPQLYDELRHA